MLEERLAKWRGIDHWIEADATVTSYEIVSEGGYRQGPPRARITFYYHDQQAALQSGKLIADSFTSLYNLSVSDTFQLCFNPSRPEQFYSAEATSWFTEYRLFFWVGLALFCVVFAAITIFKQK